MLHHEFSDIGIGINRMYVTRGLHGRGFIFLLCVCVWLSVDGWICNESMDGYTECPPKNDTSLV